MTGLPWFKCYPRDFNDGMMGLTLEERGAYVTILNVIYARGGPIDDDPSYFRALLCCSPKAWVKIRAALLVKRKLFEVSMDGIPSLMNRRAAEEIEENREMRRKFSERGSKGGQKAQAVLKENKALGQQQADLGSTIEDTEAESEADKKDREAIASLIRSFGHALERVTKAIVEKRIADGFRVFWEAYPRRVAKDAASKAFAKAYRRVGTEEPLAVILAGIERALPGWDDRNFIPYPASWLNAGRWGDEPPTPKTSAERPRNDQPPRSKSDHLAAIARAMADAGGGQDGSGGYSPEPRPGGGMPAIRSAA